MVAMSDKLCFVSKELDGLLQHSWKCKACYSPTLCGIAAIMSRSEQQRVFVGGLWRFVWPVFNKVARIDKAAAAHTTNLFYKAIHFISITTIITIVKMTLVLLYNI